MKKMLMMLLITLPMLTACPFDGKKGKVGTTGPQGTQGVPGVQGGQGIQGVAGIAGIQGLNGLACWDLNEDGQQTFADTNDPAVIDEDINGDGEIDVVDCAGLNGDVGDDCRMGVYISGAYLLQALNDGSGALLHTSMVIVDTVLERHPLPDGPLLFGVSAMETKDGSVLTIFRGDDGLLTGPWVGSCLSPPPA